MITTWKKPLNFYEKKYNRLKKENKHSEKEIANILINSWE